MATQVRTKPEEAVPESENAVRTRIGWQGVRCDLPADWSVVGFSMDRASGYLRVDAPGDSALTVQIRWTDAKRPAQKTLYHLLASQVFRWLRRPDISIETPDLKANLEKILKETEKQAKKAKSNFESTIKPEKTEGANEERTAINFSWSGAGRGQGKIWYCAHCHRLVVAQVVGLNKDSSAISAVASQLFNTLEDHSEDGYDLWALYDLEIEVPEDFRLESQKLLSGYLNLTFLRGSEKLIVDRWGLANMALKKFTMEEWMRNNALVSLKRQTKSEVESESGHVLTRFTGSLPLLARLKALRDGKLSLRRFPTRYAAAGWRCEDSNKIYALQLLHPRASEDVMDEVLDRCVCH